MFDLYFSFFIYYQKSQRQISDPLVIMTILDITLVYLFFFFLFLEPLLYLRLLFFCLKIHFDLLARILPQYDTIQQLLQ